VGRRGERVLAAAQEQQPQGHVRSQVGAVSDYGVICANPRSQKATQPQHFQLSSACHHLKIIFAIVKIPFIF